MDVGRPRPGPSALVFQAVALIAYVVALLGWPAPPAEPPQAAASGVDRTLEAIEPVAQRCASADPPDWRAFARALDGIGGPAATLVAWAPRVSESARAGYEASTGGDAFRAFLIREPDGHGGLREVTARREHFPLHLVYPPTRSNALLGLDLLADPMLGQAIARAGRSATPSVVIPSKGLLGSGSSPLVVVPVVRDGRLVGVMVAAVPEVQPAVGSPRLVTRPGPR